MGIAPPRQAQEPLVLIVEDDAGTRELYRDYLSHAGFRIVDAHNGHQALAKAQEVRLRQDHRTRATPILAITGHSKYLDQPARFKRAGISEVLMKPCPPDVIAEQLWRLLGNVPAVLSE